MQPSTHQQHAVLSLEEALAEVLEDCPKGSSWLSILLTLEQALIAYCTKEMVYVRIGNAKPQHKALPIRRDLSGELVQVAEMLETSKKVLHARVEETWHCPGTT